jgi:hypothetical protein
MSKFYIYTAFSRDYDNLMALPNGFIRGCTPVAFVNGQTANGWDVRLFENRTATQKLNAKFYKVLPHVVFSDADYSLWIDGSFKVFTHDCVWGLVQKYLQDSDICVFRHPKRNSCYEEAAACIAQKLDDPQVIFDQAARYQADGYQDTELFECCVILRRRTPAVARFNEIWWDEIVKGSTRDQISFGYAAHKAGLKVSTFYGENKQHSAGWIQKWGHR